MNILQIIPNVGTGGAERFVVDLSNELSCGNQVSLLTLYGPMTGDIFRNELMESVANYSLNKKPGFDVQMIRRLYDTIKLVQPDIIHSHLRSLNYLLALNPFLNKVPVVHTIHNDAFKECPNVLQRGIRKYFFRNREVYPVTISREGKRSFEFAYENTKSDLIINGRKPIAQSNSITEVYEELNSYKNKSSDLVFVHIGRMEPQKNQIILINAFKRLIVEERSNAILLLIGGGRSSVESREIQESLQVAVSGWPQIRILGEKSNVTDYLYASDFFCLSSIFEGMPISLIEAFATGTIPICTPVGGIPEMLNGLDSSLLAKSTSESDYYETLKNAYYLPVSEKEQLKHNAKKLFEDNYSINKCAIAYEQLYRRLTAINR